jgi:hypothetical protein
MEDTEPEHVVNELKSYLFVIGSLLGFCSLNTIFVVMICNSDIMEETNTIGACLNHPGAWRRRFRKDSDIRAYGIIMVTTTSTQGQHSDNKRGSRTP